MKRTVIKLFIVAAVMVALFCLGNFAFYSAFAEEPEADITNVTDVTEEPVTDVTEAETELSQEVKDLKTQFVEIVAKYNSWNDDNYFANNILPVLLGAGSALLGWLGVLIPSIRKNAQYKQLQGAYAMLNKNYEEIQKLLTSTDPEEIKKALSLVVSDETKRQIEETVKKIKVDYEALGEVKAQTQVLLAQVKALCDAAKVTWHGQPQAVALLSAAPTQEAVNEIAAENAKLKAYIREQNDKGDEVINEIIAG